MGRARVRIIKRHLDLLTREAVSKARSRQREIAGIMLDHGGVVGLLELHNVSRRRGRFDIRVADIRAKRAAARELGSSVVGYFHSHIVSSAVPSPGDLAEAPSGQLMLIIDTISREARLWRVHRGRAYAVGYTLV